MTSEQKKYLSMGIFCAICFAIVVNLYYLFTQNYVKVIEKSDSSEEIISIQYSELMSQEESFSRQLTTYLLDEPYGTDSGAYEKLGFLAVVLGSALMGLGAIMFYKSKAVGLFLSGGLLSCIGTFVFYYIIQTAEKSLQESLVGTLGSMFGMFFVFDTTAGTWMFLSLLTTGAMAVLVYLYTRKNNNNESEANTNGT